MMKRFQTCCVGRQSQSKEIIVPILLKDKTQIVYQLHFESLLSASWKQSEWRVAFFSLSFFGYLFWCYATLGTGLQQRQQETNSACFDSSEIYFPHKHITKAIRSSVGYTWVNFTPSTTFKKPFGLKTWKYWLTLKDTINNL